MERECVKIANLRRIYGSDMNFEKWLNNDNIYEVEEYL
jgi:hypothetical protein